MKIEKTVVRFLAPVLGACFCVGTMAHAVSPKADPAPQVIATQASSPQGKPATPSDTATDLKFAEFFKTPVGPKGLEATEKLLALNGHRVRIVGYLAGTDEPVADLSYLTPYPIVLGHEDEHLSDDLPVTTVFVHSGTLGKPIPHHGGLVRLTGRLAVGPSDEPDGRVSSIRLSLDRESFDSLSGTGVTRRSSSKGPAVHAHP